MTDGNTHAINQHLNEREDYDALQEVTAELEQAEARIVELEAKLSKSEALLEKAVSFTSDAAYRATTIEHDRDEMWLLDLDVLRHERDCDITQARTTLAELKGQDDAE